MPWLDGAADAAWRGCGCLVYLAGLPQPETVSWVTGACAIAAWTPVDGRQHPPWQVMAGSAASAGGLSPGDMLVTLHDLEVDP